MASNPNEQTVTALVENKAGVLARVVGLFARRGFNISSLAVAPTEDERFSRITFVYDIGSAPVEQVLNQVNKLINVIHIEAIDPEKSLERELLLVNVSTTDDNRQKIKDLAASFGGTIENEAPFFLTISLAGEPSNLDKFEAQVRQYGISSLQRTGRIALPTA